MDCKSENNKVMLMGKIVSSFEFQVKYKEEYFYRITLQVKRQSGQCDFIPLLISDRLIDITKDYVGQLICVSGQFRSHNSREKTRTRLLLHVFVKELDFLDSVEEVGSMNEIFLNGFLCKCPIYRRTPSGKEIADILLAVNREHLKTDYIPCIVWGRNAKFASRLSVGDQLQITGRIQSREYDKRETQGIVRKRAYEISVFRLDLMK